MKKLILFAILLPLFVSCSKRKKEEYKELYYLFDTMFGLVIKDKTGSDLLDKNLQVEKITLFGDNIGGNSPTKGLMTPDGPPFESFSVKKKGADNILSLTFIPIYSNSYLSIKWKNIAQADTLMAELYNRRNRVFTKKIYWNGVQIWNEEEQKSKNQLIIEKKLK